MKSCQIYQVANLIGHRWSALILLAFLRNPESLKYSQIESDLSGITAKVLSERLHQLVEEKIITRNVDSTKSPPQISYAITEKGQALLPVIKSMQEWTEKFSICENKSTCSRCSF